MFKRPTPPLPKSPPGEDQVSRRDDAVPRVFAARIRAGVGGSGRIATAAVGMTLAALANSACSGSARTEFTAEDGDAGQAPPASDDTKKKKKDVVEAMGCGVFCAHEFPIQSLAFSADGTILASYADSLAANSITAAEQGYIKLWSTSDGSLVKKQEIPLPGTRIAISRDGATVAWGTGTGISLWQVATGSVSSIEDDQISGAPGSLGFSPDGAHLVTTGGDAFNESPDAYVWSVSSRKVILTLKSCRGEPAFSPDGTLLAVGNDDSVTLWSLRDGALVLQLNVPGNALAFSPDGSLLAAGSSLDPTAGSSPGIVRIFKVDDGSLVTSLEDHSDNVWAIAFSPDGTSLVSGSESEVLVHRVAGWERTLTVEGQFGSITLSQTANMVAGSVMVKDENGVQRSAAIRVVPVPLADPQRCLLDPSASPAGTASYLSVRDETMAGATCTCDSVCTCNTVAVPSGSGVTRPANATCTCDTVSVGKAGAWPTVGGSGGGGSYWYPN